MNLEISIKNIITNQDRIQNSQGALDSFTVAGGLGSNQDLWALCGQSLYFGHVSTAFHTSARLSPHPAKPKGAASCHQRGRYSLNFLQDSAFGRKTQASKIQKGKGTKKSPKHISTAACRCHLWDSPYQHRSTRLHIFRQLKPWEGRSAYLHSVTQAALAWLSCSAWQQMRAATEGNFLPWQCQYNLTRRGHRSSAQRRASVVGLGARPEQRAPSCSKQHVAVGVCCTSAAHPGSTASPTACH